MRVVGRAHAPDGHVLSEVQGVHVWYLVDTQAGQAWPTNDAPVAPVLVTSRVWFAGSTFSLYRCTAGRIWGRLDTGCNGCGG